MNVSDFEYLMIVRLGWLMSVMRHLEPKWSCYIANTSYTIESRRVNINDLLWGDLLRCPKEQGNGSRRDVQIIVHSLERLMLLAGDERECLKIDRRALCSPIFVVKVEETTTQALVENVRASKSKGAVGTE